jgi:hypothetical protein
VVEALLLFSAIYAYWVNAKRATDDPKKMDISPYAILLAPISIPILLVVNLIFLALQSLELGIFLLLFPLALLLFRKPFLIKWILKHAEKAGNKLLKINTAFLRAVGLYQPPLLKFISTDLAAHRE